MTKAFSFWEFLFWKYRADSKFAPSQWDVTKLRRLSLAGRKLRISPAIVAIAQHMAEKKTSQESHYVDRWSGLYDKYDTLGELNYCSGFNQPIVSCIDFDLLFETNLQPGVPFPNTIWLISRYVQVITQSYVGIVIHPYPNLNYTTVEVTKWMSNYIPLLYPHRCNYLSTP